RGRRRAGAALRLREGGGELLLDLRDRGRPLVGRARLRALLLIRALGEQQGVALRGRRLGDLRAALRLVFGGEGEARVDGLDERAARGVDERARGRRCDERRRAVGSGGAALVLGPSPGGRERTLRLRDSRVALGGVARLLEARPRIQHGRAEEPGVLVLRG